MTVFVKTVFASEERSRVGTSTEILGDDAILFPNTRVLLWGYSHFSSGRSAGCKNLKLSHFGCGTMTEDTLHALNQVRQCHITPEELETIQMKIIFNRSISDRN